MKLNFDGVTRYIGRQILLTKKNSPHIFFVGGVVGIIGSGVMACRATLKLEETLDEIKTDIDTAKEINKDGSDTEIEAAYKNLGYISVKSTLAVGRLYGPSIALGAVSVAALTGSHIQLTRRNTALSATLAMVTKAYDEYRHRVQEEIGEKRELDIYHGVKKKEIEEDGKKKTVKVADPNACSPYARFFDSANINWENNSEYNFMFITCQQNYANDKLRAQGHVFLNDVYDWLGFERTSAGAIVGWVRDGDGDGYVDFNIHADGNLVNNRLDKSIILDFNVDGVVYDKI